jgi:hypothetical protein
VVVVLPVAPLADPGAGMVAAVAFTAREAGVLYQDASCAPENKVEPKAKANTITALTRIVSSLERIPIIITISLNLLLSKKQHELDDNRCMLFYFFARDRLITKTAFFLVALYAIAAAYASVSVNADTLLILLAFILALLLIGSLAGDALAFWLPIHEDRILTRMMLPIAALAIGIVCSTVSRSGFPDVICDAIAACAYTWARQPT